MHATRQGEGVTAMVGVLAFAALAVFPPSAVAAVAAFGAVAGFAARAGPTIATMLLVRAVACSSLSSSALSGTSRWPDNGSSGR